VRYVCPLELTADVAESTVSVATFSIEKMTDQKEWLHERKYFQKEKQ
jgi:hypothetical protein